MDENTQANTPADTAGAEPAQDAGNAAQPNANAAPDVPDTNVTASNTDTASTPAADTPAPEVVDQGTQAPVAPAPVVTSLPDTLPTAPAAPVVQPTAKQTEPVSGFVAAMDKLKLTGTSNERTLIANIELYMGNMKPGMPVNASAGAVAQYTFWNVIKNIAHNAPGNEFKSLWNILLGYFEEHKNGVFHERYIYRFPEAWHKEVKELTAYQRILNLIKLTANPATRQHALKQVDLDRTLSEGFGEEARNRIISFYKR